MSKASGEDHWEAQRYISPREATAIPTISHQGKTTSEHQDKVDILAGIPFSPPVPSDVDRGQEGPTGQAFERVNNLQTRKPLQDTNNKKSTGPDGIGPLVIRAVSFSWGAPSVVALI